MSTDSIRSPVLGDLFPRLQSLEEGLLWREPAEVAGRSADAYGRCDCWYACSVLHDSVRRHQDPTAGRGTEGRGYLYRPSARGQNHLPTGGIQGLLQGWPGPYYAIVSPVRLHTGRVRSTSTASQLSRLNQHNRNGC